MQHMWVKRERCFCKSNVGLLCSLIILWQAKRQSVWEVFFFSKVKHGVCTHKQTHFCLIFTQSEYWLHQTDEAVLLCFSHSNLHTCVETQCLFLACNPLHYPRLLSPNDGWKLFFCCSAVCAQRKSSHMWRCCSERLWSLGIAGAGQSGPNSLCALQPSTATRYSKHW